MVFYYSATGNSLWVAKELAEKQGERLVCVTDELKQGSGLHDVIGENEAMGFVFPVHAWNPPDTLLRFIKRMAIEGNGHYVYAVATCGDSAGNTMKVLSKALAEKGLGLGACWEMAMPNNYLPLQDVDSPQVAYDKLAKAEAMTAHINRCVSARSTEKQLIAEGFKSLKTSLIGFFFRRLGKGTKPFHVTGACTGCGFCEKICLSHAIHMRERRPTWEKTCDQCFACINRCPTRAIQYGKKTAKRGRYCHPSMSGKA